MPPAKRRRERVLPSRFRDSAVLLPPGALAEPLPPLLARICASHGHAGGVALTAASLVEAFLVAEQRDSPSEVGCDRLVLTHV